MTDKKLLRTELIVAVLAFATALAACTCQFASLYIIIAERSIPICLSFLAGMVINSFTFFQLMALQDEIGKEIERRGLKKTRKFIEA